MSISVQMYESVIMQNLALKEEIERLRAAMYDIANPLQRIKRGMPEGAKLNGQMAVQLMESPDFYRDIAREALSAETKAQPSAEAPHEWQPIETAPKDGRDFLASTDGGIICVMRFCGNEIIRSVTCRRCDHMGLGNLRYWMPLPELPKEVRG